MEDKITDFCFYFSRWGFEDHEHSSGHVDLGLFLEKSSRTKIWTKDRNLRIKNKIKTKKN